MTTLPEASDEREPGCPDRPRAWFRCRLGEYASHPNLDAVYGRLVAGAAASGLNADAAQVQAWQATLPKLQKVIHDLLSQRPDIADAALFVEYEIPRRSKRIDVVVVAGNTVVVIEFKTSTAQFVRASRWQAEDYAMDLRDFHRGSRQNTILAILAATDSEEFTREVHDASVPMWECTADRLASVLEKTIRHCTTRGDSLCWADEPYDPTPDVIAAARSIFAEHSVEAINRASADNLDDTLRTIHEIANDCLAHRRHGICFVTGVPGSGKTLAGLSAAQTGEEYIRATFLSGNGPLITVLREAVARDASERLGGVTAARRHAQTLIQNVHQFIEEYGINRPSEVPPEQVVVFDEAQRAWHANRMSSKRRRELPSEPSLMLDIMGRHDAGCLIVALIGHGQEIHNGEAGLAEWGRALRSSSHTWHVHASPSVLRADQPDPSRRLFDDSGVGSHVIPQDALHLSAVIRSPRATVMAEWVDAVLNGRVDNARMLLRSLAGFRLNLTRDLSVARRWLRDATRDEMRPGLLASSGALRLRPEGLELDTNFQRAYPIERWFLDAPDDVRSSHALEVAMTEFSCQGLELDYTAVCWDADLTRASDEWDMRRFSGTAWKRVLNPVDHRFIINKYRVLLTRAREGMIIWVPRGNSTDRTREPSRYDTLADYLRRCGIAGCDDSV